MRGNSYSRNHTTLSPDDPAFWQFGFEESAVIDYPEAIDFILEKTGHEDLFFIGTFLLICFLLFLYFFFFLFPHE